MSDFALATETTSDFQTVAIQLGNYFGLHLRKVNPRAVIRINLVGKNEESLALFEHAMAQAVLSGHHVGPSEDEHILGVYQRQAGKFAGKIRQAVFVNRTGYNDFKKSLASIPDLIHPGVMIIRYPDETAVNADQDPSVIKIRDSITVKINHLWKDIRSLDFTFNTPDFPKTAFHINVMGAKQVISPA